jgi:CCR4-NOT transcription complex subunit 6
MSLRVDRPVEGCTLRSHAYMYGKKLDDREMEKKKKQLLDMPKHQQQPQHGQQHPLLLLNPNPPPPHEFSYKWFRGPEQEFCAYEDCPRRTSFSPHDWSMHALGGSGSSLQCVSTQSSLYKSTFCNPQCFCKAWKTQYTVNQTHRTPGRQISHSITIEDDSKSVGSTGSTGGFSSNGSVGSSNNNYNPSTPKGYVGGYNSSNHYYNYNQEYKGDSEDDGWVEISRDSIYTPTKDDVGRKLRLECFAYSLDNGELLMQRVVKTDLALSRAPDPVKRNLVTAKMMMNMMRQQSNQSNSSNSSANNAGSSRGGGMVGGGERFRIATYNVLAEIYATQQQYPYCDFWALSFDYRFQNILREILDAAPDVICLQEVQADYYETHIYNALSENGFEGVYKQKTRQSMGLMGKVDGCALFWRRTKFHLVESYSIEFNELAQRQCTQVLGMNPRSEEGVAFLNKLCKDNVAQLVVLELAISNNNSHSSNSHSNSHSGNNTNNNNNNSSNSNKHQQQLPQQVCIANTHLYSNKDFPDVKLWQTWQLLQELETFVLSRGTNLPLMICGDFNSTPDTAVYDLLSRQAVHPGHPDVNIHSGNSNNSNHHQNSYHPHHSHHQHHHSEDNSNSNNPNNASSNSNQNNSTSASTTSSANILPDPMSISHSFQLGSVYNTIMGEEPKATNFTVAFKGVLDYMWYSMPNLRALSTAPIPDESVLTKYGEALPSTQYSSDHIMLISDMQIMGGSRPPP